jgi:hypothetical protein
VSLRSNPQNLQRLLRLHYNGPDDGDGICLRNDGGFEHPDRISLNKVKDSGRTAQ